MEKFLFLKKKVYCNCDNTHYSKLLDYIQIVLVLET